MYLPLGSPAAQLRSETFNNTLSQHDWHVNINICSGFILFAGYETKMRIICLDIPASVSSNINIMCRLTDLIGRCSIKQVSVEVE